MPGRGPERAFEQAEGDPEVLVDVGLVWIARHRLDDAGQVDVRRVAVAVPRAGREQDLLVGHHAHQLLPAGRLERFPGHVPAIGPCRVLEAGGVREQHPQGDAVHRTEGIVYLAQVGNPAGDRVVEREQAPVPQAQDRDRGQGLGDGTPMENGSRSHGTSGGPVLQAGVVAPDDASVAQQGEAPAHDTVGLEEPVEGRGRGTPRAVGNGLGREPRRQEERQGEREGQAGGTQHGGSGVGGSANLRPGNAPVNRAGGRRSRRGRRSGGSRSPGRPRPPRGAGRRDRTDRPGSDGPCTGSSPLAAAAT